jgi:exopolysaccharide production protein ExoQ
MAPSLALGLWFILLVGLLCFDPAKSPNTSPALWIPIIAMFIAGTRNISQWLTGQVGISAAAFEEGNPLDRVISLGLILLAIGVLMARSLNWGAFIARNLALLAFLSFALVSVLWSDFPFTAFKRWFRDLGIYLMILVVLSDPRPVEAVRTVLRRLAYLMVPLSILLIKYYSAIGKHYSYWTGEAEFVGAATSKNMLGLLCLISGLYFFWDTVTRWTERKQGRVKRILLVNFSFIGMTLWLMRLAQSTTSEVCLLIGCLVIVAAHLRFFKRRPTALKVFVPSLFGLYLILNFGLNMNGSMAQAVGKDPTMTDRTKIWAFVLGMHTNPLFGTGYQSFWLGPRLQYFWMHSGLGHLNEAHNGYLEVYLELGLLGVFILLGFLFAGYRVICKGLTSRSDLAILALATWVTLLFYNMSEAAFENGLLWTMLMFGAVALPKRIKERIHVRTPLDEPAREYRIQDLSLETTSRG